MRCLVASLLPALLTACSGMPGRVSEAPGPSEGFYQAPPQARPLSAKEAASDKNVIGCVKVEYLIKPDGSVSDVSILESVPAGYFDARVLMLMENVRFRPRNAIAFADRTFSFAPNQAPEVLASAAKLCERSAQERLPPPPVSGVLDEKNTYSTDSKNDQGPRRPIGR